MIYQKIEQVLFDIDGAFIHEPMLGFREDYLCLHSLLRRYNPKTVFEIGTNTGNGVNVIATALPTSEVYSLDLDFETMRELSLQYPIGDNGEDKIGSDTKFPYTQLRGNSMSFDYSKYPCEGYYVDGEHTNKNVYHETMEILKIRPKIIIYHDTDMQEVMNGLVHAHLDSANGDEYILHRVEETRISYLLNNMK